MAGHDDFDDAEFIELFGAFDDVVASEDLKARTLAAVRGGLDTLSTGYLELIAKIEKEVNG